MFKYYFGYRSFHGQVFPGTWVEDGGKCVGGELPCLAKKELAKDLFDQLSLTTLSQIYPLSELLKESQ